MEGEGLQRLADIHWREKGQSEFDEQLMKKLYHDISETDFNHRQCMVLEFTQYLEKYLWPHFNIERSSREFVLSIAAIVNSKSRERISAWPMFCETPDCFKDFLRVMMLFALDEELTASERIVLVTFITNIYSSLDVDVIREQMRRTISIGIWTHLGSVHRELLLSKNVKLKRLFRAVKKLDSKLPDEQKKTVHFERGFLVNLIDQFLDSVDRGSADTTNVLLERNRLRLMECMVQLFIDLDSSLVTRRYFNALLQDRQLIVRCRNSALVKLDQCRLLRQLLEMLEFYIDFGINDETGEAIPESDTDRLHSDRIVRLQKTLFQRKDLPDRLRNFCVTNISNAESVDVLQKNITKLTLQQLKEITENLGLLPPSTDDENKEKIYSNEELLQNILILHHKKKVSQTTAIDNLPLYPTEDVIWDENLVPIERYSYDASFALPKLNIQFLTILDYLLRNFHLFRLESTYEIRQDIEDAVVRMKPWKSENDETVFGGWSRMALPIQNFSIIEVAKPHLGQSHPSRVRADVSLTLNLKQNVRFEWEALRRHDPCFLLTIKAILPYGTQFSFKNPFRNQIHVVYVRGCEIEGMLDDEGKLLADDPETRNQQPLSGDTRTWRIRLDPSQYQLDMQKKIEKGQNEDDVYDTFNVLLRRKPKENNFKAVLDTIRELMNTECVVPDWLHDVLLGYEDPASAHYMNRPEHFIQSQDWRDTFVDREHLIECFPKHEIEFAVEDSSPPYRLTFERPGENDATPKLKVNPYPWKIVYGQNIKKNNVRFTSTQIEAIRSGMQPGLTVVVGPPGTGKTDVAVQIISNLYQNYPNQRTLIVTHSNQALNQLFEKIMHLNIEEHHLLRLGHGEETLDTEKDFSRYGRVNYVLSRRLQLLQLVSDLAKCLGVPPDAGHSCQTAEFFYLYHVVSRWEQFLERVKTAKSKDEENHINEWFPFHTFFQEKPLFNGLSAEQDMEKAKLCYDNIQRVFKQLEEFRPFELMRTGVERANYLLVQEAKITAMTCTHAALRRRDLVELGFTYDNILMEESAQILEIETFIPLLLQNPDISGRNRLKRWIMIGDHHQLPPVIKNMVFQKHCNMEQSLFSRFIKLGIPVVQLDAQGRARDTICKLYRWRYNKLDSLPHVLQERSFQMANPGFLYDYQMINVEDYEGFGESEPNPFFYQNLAEAEYVVATYIYMRTLGYPAEKISILTTYNGQKHLIRDVINTKCGENPMIGRPHCVTTVDRYQGQQNDYVLLSLVRTKFVGHLRDVRRLIVALSRARLGIYIFGRVSLFEHCLELQPAMRLLKEKPQCLKLLPLESYETIRRRANNQVPEKFVKTISSMREMWTYCTNLYKQQLNFVVEQRRQQYEMSRFHLLREEKQKHEKLRREREKKKLEDKTTTSTEDASASSSKRPRIEEAESQRITYDDMETSIPQSHTVEEEDSNQKSATETIVLSGTENSDGKSNCLENTSEIGSNGVNADTTNDSGTITAGEGGENVADSRQESAAIIVTDADASTTTNEGEI